MSEDDILELLMDRAVSKILSEVELWRDETFCHSLYDDTTLKQAVERVYKIVHNEEQEYDFINEFIERECSREISNYHKKVSNNVEDDKKLNHREEKYDDDKAYLERQLSRSEVVIRSQYVASRKYKLTIIDHGFDPQYQWALFRRKYLRNVYMRSM